MRDRDRLELEPVQFRAFLESEDRLLAIWTVVIDEADLLALQLVHAAKFLGDMLNGNVGRRPVATYGDEIPSEDAAVPALGPPIAGRQKRDLVARHLLSEGEGDARRQRREVACARGALALETLVALH